MREFTFRSLILGSLLGIVFGLVTVYVALEVGLNFSASIPISVLSITVFKYLGNPTILENNMVQTVGSAGESIAAGVVYTIPALLFLGYRLQIWRIFWLALIGGVLGVLFMIPLRHFLVVDEHKTLRYPEGTACANILQAGDLGGRFARVVFLGLLIGIVDKFLMTGLQLWRSVISWSPTALRGAIFSLDLSPELMGIGSLVGLSVARVLLAGSLVSSVVLVPLIYFFGESLAAPLYPSAVPISSMLPAEIWSNYVRYVGAGGVITGGAILLVATLPTVWGSFRSQFRKRPSFARGTDQSLTRAERDLPIRWVAASVAATLVVLYALLAWKINPHASANLLSVVLVALLGFFFVVVSARITGLMGSSANPISGMTIAVVMLTCLIFLLAGWVRGPYEVIAISIGAVVCIASSNAGTTAQDLKTGYLVGATPAFQQIGLLVGVLTSVMAVGFTLTWLNNDSAAPVSAASAELPGSSVLVQSGIQYQHQNYDIYSIRAGAGLAPGRYYVLRSTGKVRFRENQRIGSAQLPAPQAQVMAVLVEGLLNNRMRWRLLLVGIFLAGIVELVGVRSLPFAVGTYLPISATAAILAGALITEAARARCSPAKRDALDSGTLYASGLIAGGAICAIIVAVLTNVGAADVLNFSRSMSYSFLPSPVLPVVAFGILGWLLWRATRSAL